MVTRTQAKKLSDFMIGSPTEAFPQASLLDLEVTLVTLKCTGYVQHARSWLALIRLSEGSHMHSICIRCIEYESGSGISTLPNHFVIRCRTTRLSSSWGTGRTLSPAVHSALSRVCNANH